MSFTCLSFTLFNSCIDFFSFIIDFKCPLIDNDYHFLLRRHCLVGINGMGFGCVGYENSAYFFYIFPSPFKCYSLTRDFYCAPSIYFTFSATDNNEHAYNDQVSMK